jgi:CPA1 family monovalent cation:H+ antiporter
LPALSALGLGERVDRAYKVVILWGGLRGAVTLALALAVTETPGIDPEIKNFVGVLATGFVFFTLLVNATTLRPVIRLLKLDRLSPLDRALRDRAIALALGNVAERMERAGREYRLDQSVIDRTNETYRQRQKQVLEEAERSDGLDAASRERLGLIALANREEELYFEHFSGGAVSRSTVIRLIAKAGRLRDAAKTGGREAYLKAALDSLQFRIAFRIANLAHRWLRLEKPLARRLGDRFEMLLVSRMVISNLRGFTADKLTPLLGGAAAEALDEDLAHRLQSCEQALEALRLQYPTYAEDLQQRFLTRAALRMEAEEVRVLHQESAITQEVFADLTRRIERDRRRVDVRPKLDLELSVEQLIGRFPMFEGLETTSLREICGMMKSRLAVPGDRLITRGERGDSMYFIASGAVEVDRDGQQHRLGRGDFFGELALLTGQRRTADVTAIAYCRLLELSGRDFRRFLKAHPDVRAEIRRVADARLRRRTGETIEAT